MNLRSLLKVNLRTASIRSKGSAESLMLNGRREKGCQSGGEMSSL